MTPKLHLHPEKNWMNDPNGFIFFDGLYHLFYQYFPYATTWGQPHWMHTTSRDLLHFTEHGIAVFPSKLFDSHGCYSGTALEKDGQLYLYYTGIHSDRPNPENIHVSHDNEACQVLLKSADGFTFDNYADKKMVIPAGGVLHPKQTRDPKVWKHNDTYYMVIVSQYADEEGKWNGQLAFYSSKDAENWQFERFYRGFKLGNMWECPDLFEADGQWLLILSPENTETHGYPSQAQIVPVNFDNDTLELEALREMELLDYGRDLYAPQTTLHEDGRRIYIGWLRMPEPIDGWRGVMTYPRQIHYKEGVIFTPMLQEAADRFSKEGPFDPEIPCCITCTLFEGDWIDIGGYRLEVKDHHLTADRSRVFVDTEEADSITETPALEHATLEIYVDGPVIETYVNSGQYVLTNIVYHLSDTITSNTTYSVFQYQEEN